MRSVHSRSTSIATSIATLIAAAALGLGGAGCASGEHDTTFHFLVVPAPDATFNGWTEITLGVDINSVGTTNLWGMTMGMKAPAPLPDLTFLSTLTGQAQTATGLTTVVTEDSFPKGAPSVEMTVAYFGDLHPLFEDAHTIRLNWSGATNPAFTDWPAGGIWMEGDVIINVQ
jgi:hypothetical protein